MPALRAVAAIALLVWALIASIPAAADTPLQVGGTVAGTYVGGGDQSVRVTWAAPTTGAVGPYVKWTDDAGQTNHAAGRTFTDQDIGPWNTSTIAQGRHTVTVLAWYCARPFPAGGECAKAVTTTQVLTPIVDRTAPGAPSAFRASLDLSTAQASIVWDDALDPTQPDGTPGSGTTAYQYRYARGTGAWSGWATSDYDGFVLPSSFDGEAISVEVRPQDAVGNVGGSTTASIAVTAPPTDTTPPALSLSGLQTAYGSADNTTLIDWNAAADPDFPDGSPSSGVAGYNVRYSLDGGAWSAWGSSPSSRLTFPGGHAGQSVAVEISAYDAAGNTSAVQSGTATSVAYTGAAGTLACWPSDEGLPPDCNDPADMNEPDGGPAATLTQQRATSALSPNTATNLPRYTIHVGGLWTTARLRAGSYVVGNVKDGWTLDRVGSDVNAYAFGTIRGAFQGCGWIATQFIPGSPYANNGTSNCVNLGDTGLPKLSTIALSVNALRTSGSDTKLLTTQVNGVKLCAYITPWPGVTNQGHQCGGVYKKVTYAQISASGGYTVKWRYVTRDDKWVLVQDSNADHHNDSYGAINWWFVRRSALGVLCPHPRFSDSPGGTSCAPTN
jgi:hypothetical protein